MSILKTAARVRYGDDVEEALGRIEALLGDDYSISKRAVALLLLQNDAEVEALVKGREGETYGRIREILQEARSHRSRSLNYVITMRRKQEVDRIVARVLMAPEISGKSFSETLSRMTMSPITGIPILLLVLYYGIYQFVGVFGAGTVVDFLEGTVFEGYINPFATDIFTRIIPWVTLRNLFVGEYGVITLGVRYAIAIILPIVGTFFITFSVLEDSGYFPRLAMLIDRVFKKIGLNGRAVIPMVLGFGCDTMATMVTRILETKRERVIGTLLLALAVPCSAQLGVIIAFLSGTRGGLLIWAGVVAAEFLLIGYLASKVMPGGKPSFYMEVPPLRLPNISNVLTKTYTRMQWYFFEVFPLFILASLLIWIGQVTGVFRLVVSALEPLVRFIGLPDEAAVAFLFGFFRRDYGAAGLFDLQGSEVLSGVQLVVAAVTLTLFLPCIAQFLIMKKERGLKTAIFISLFIFPFAFFTGYLLNFILNSLNVQI